MNRSDLRGWLVSTKVSAPARFVFLALALHENPAGRGAWPSNRALVDETGLARRTVQRALRELEVAGDLSSRDRLGAATVYYLTTEGGATVTQGGRQGDMGGHVTVARGGVTDDPKGRHSGAQKELGRIKEGRSDAPPQNGVAARTATPSPVVTRDDGATFLPGTGWVHTQ